MIQFDQNKTKIYKYLNPNNKTENNKVVPRIADSQKFTSFEPPGSFEAPGIVKEL